MRQIPVYALALLIMSGCSGIKTVSDYDPTVDFSQFKTFEFYGWDKNTSEDLNAFDKKRIETAFNDEFKKLELEMVEKDSGGDLIVSLHLVTEEKTQSRTVSEPANSNFGVSGYVGYGGYFGYGPGWGYSPGLGYSGYNTTYVEELNYNEGTLICSIYDAKKKHLIWEGAATKTIEKNPEMRKKSIPYAVRAIMRKYPKKKPKKKPTEI